ncbi:MAG TPA: cytochrome P450 [Crenalkalicoccus sp.]|nr:cytochrome P450 [Crenalkalicoccus sp.]
MPDTPPDTLPDTLTDARPAPFTPPVMRAPERELPLLALLRAFRTNALTAWPRAAYESPVLVRPFFGRRSALLNDPAAIREVLLDGEERFGRSAATIRLLRPLLGRGLFLAEGAAWKHQRRTLAPAFTPRAIGLLVPRMQAAIAEELERLEAAARQRTSLDLLTASQHLALEVAGRTMLSIGMRRFAPTLRQMVFRYGREGSPATLDLLLPAAIMTPRDMVRGRHGRRWMDFVGRIMAARRQAGPDGPRDLLDLIEQARDPETGRGFSAVELRDQIATMILAGHETTALTLFWSLALLAQAPEWQALVAEEAAAAGGDPARMRLARAVVEEALRLYPPAFAIVRVAKRKEVLAGAELAPGDAAVVAPWVLHRHRKLWPAPDAFDPRRFLAPAPPPERFSYLPFGAGPRACIGAQFALVEATLALSAIIGRFRIALADQRPVLPVAVMTTVPDHVPGFRVRRR